LRSNDIKNLWLEIIPACGLDLWQGMISGDAFSRTEVQAAHFKTTQNFVAFTDVVPLLPPTMSDT
jgi:hypothetical protein